MNKDESDRNEKKAQDIKLWGVFIFGLIGATVTAFSERIRRMQSVFNRERDKHRRNYESWKENGAGAHHQHFQRDDWYWKAEASFREQWANQHTQRGSGNYSLSHHYSVLGLDRFRTTPYTEAEIKTAFRTKAKQYHPDQNQDNREAAEAKFKEVICSYEAIQQERKNQNL
ncbi:uncharacterized protein LOC114385450 isoform X2 [Glycine soja]|uniref:J domain-containing protein n=2 Tax=Glycine subgen. Soja TaxID=1462606 RepID=K7M5T5_SOYBN|nr:uncharacterized protein LOC100804936 isoform X2 [Glycine max]XP_028201337.1 uncharacterized protein LOC114385450 isoform X2 [Glycine soja]RZB68249.1 hypothetical protein D0Y65_038153 [Glycine soja]|eukprot:XP_006596005.1 uncharacterized protein LOC100804936 isoform X2 [Glycine max]